MMSVRALTWIHRDQIDRAPVIPARDEAMSLGATFMLPFPLRKIEAAKDDASGRRRLQLVTYDVPTRPDRRRQGATLSPAQARRNDAARRKGETP
jgi:hypothetical protein